MRQTTITDPTAADEPAAGTVLVGVFGTRVERRSDGAWYEPATMSTRSWEWVSQYAPLVVETEGAGEAPPGWIVDLSETLTDLAVAVQWLVTDRQRSGLPGAAEVLPEGAE